MERNAISIQAKRLGMAQHIHGHRRDTAELARQRPFGALAVGQHAAENARLWSSTCDLLHLFDAIDREETNAKIIGARDIALLLDRVAERDAIGRRTGIQCHLDFGDRRGVEGRAHRSKEAQDLRRRICFHRVVNPGIRQRLLEGAVIFAHDIEVDDQARPIRTSGGKEIENALCCHRSLQCTASIPRVVRLRRDRSRPLAPRWTKARRQFHDPGGGNPGSRETRVTRW